MRDIARAAFDCLTDRELQVKFAVELAEDLEALGDVPPPGFPNEFKMTRAEMLDYLAEGAVSDVTDIELVYPGATDPTA